MRVYASLRPQLGLLGIWVVNAPQRAYWHIEVGADGQARATQMQPGWHWRWRLKNVICLAQIVVFRHKFVDEEAELELMPIMSTVQVELLPPRKSKFLIRVTFPNRVDAAAAEAFWVWHQALLAKKPSSQASYEFLASSPAAFDVKMLDCYIPPQVAVRLGLMRPPGQRTQSAET